MSGDPFQPGHRPPSGLRYRREGEGLDSVGNAASFGGYAAPSGRADSWSAPAIAATWSMPVGDGRNTPSNAAWSASPDDARRGSGPRDMRPRAAHTPEDHWDTAASEDSARDAWGTGEQADDDYEQPGEPLAPAPLGVRNTRAAQRARTSRATGAHRMPAPPAALKGRAAVVAVAAGAVVAAGQAGLQQLGNRQPATADAPKTGEIRQVAASSPVAGAAASSSRGPQMLDAAPVTDLSQFQDVLHHGQQFADSLAAQAAAKLRPLYVKFAHGTFTSGYGTRWGVLHAGVDVAGPIGTPIYAVQDGTIISAGPASGFGMWVRLQAADGTITVYGHINTATVTVGQHVLAGDQIATIGNRGFSTGPHCHFEVWLHGTDRINPLPWLASRGISLGPEED